MQNHGVFTIGPTAKAAVKAAVLCEEVARTVHIARQLGEPLPIPQSDIDSLYDRYQNAYGQNAEGADMTTTPTVWFLTGSQGLYGPETLAQVEQQSQAIVAELNAAAELAVPVEWKPVLTDSRRDPSARAGRQRRPGLHRPDRLDAHLLPGQDVDHRPGRAAHPVPAPAHPGQRVAAVVRDRHGLHEPQPGGPRRPGVRLHPDPARGAPQDRRRARLQPGGRRAHLAAGSAPLWALPQSAASSSRGSATTCAMSPSPRATRSRRSCGSASR